MGRRREPPAPHRRDIWTRHVRRRCPPYRYTSTDCRPPHAVAPVVVGGFIVVVGVHFGHTFPHWVHVGHSGAEILVYLSVGYLVRTGERSTARAQSTTDSPV
jgi:hypothetical protein